VKELSAFSGIEITGFALKIVEATNGLQADLSRCHLFLIIRRRRLDIFSFMLAAP
jgi:hypothetical protein